MWSPNLRGINQSSDDDEEVHLTPGLCQVGVLFHAETKSYYLQKHLNCENQLEDQIETG
jgi:hypothetical protein